MLSTDAAEMASLNNRDVLVLHDQLTSHKGKHFRCFVFLVESSYLFSLSFAILTVAELLSQENRGADQVNSLVSLLVVNLQHNCSEGTASSSFVESWADFVAESTGRQPHLEWLQQLSSAEDSPLSALQAIHASTAALLRLQAGHAHSQNRNQEQQRQSLFRPLLGSAQASLSIPEEALERALRAANAFLNVNFLNNVMTSSSKMSGVGVSGKAVKGKGKENFQAKALSELVSF